MESSLKGKAVVVTGATSGIGFQTALEFAKEGAFLMGVGRDPQRCERAKADILRYAPNAEVKFFVADLNSQQQIRTLSQQIGEFLDQNQVRGLEVLVNNAGLYMTKKVINADGIETTFAVNHIAPFLLTHLLLPLLKLSASSRVITVSSESHYRTWINPEKAGNPRFYSGIWAYKVSKLANVLFTYEMNQRQNGCSPRAFAVDPGLVNTDIALKGTSGFVKFGWKFRQRSGVPPEVPARTILFLAKEVEVLNSPDLYWYLCKPKKPSRWAVDPVLASRLWIESCRLCGINDQ